jgi:hypothetical protein
MRRLKTTKRFERDLERAKRRGKDLDKLWARDRIPAPCVTTKRARRGEAGRAQINRFPDLYI